MGVAWGTHGTRMGRAWGTHWKWHGHRVVIAWAPGRNLSARSGILFSLHNCHMVHLLLSPMLLHARHAPLAIGLVVKCADAATHTRSDKVLQVLTTGRHLFPELALRPPRRTAVLLNNVQGKWSHPVFEFLPRFPVNC